MRSLTGLVASFAVAAASFGIVTLSAPPAQACTGDPCDGFCYTYMTLPDGVRQKVFRSEYCPLR